MEKMNASEPLKTCRKRLNGDQKQLVRKGCDELGGKPDYRLSGPRHSGGMSSIQASIGNLGTKTQMLREKYQVEDLHKDESTNAENWDGMARSSDENSVMEWERRGHILKQLGRYNQPGQESIVP